MQVVILCGGKGTRMGNDELPKPLFAIGKKPLLWHLMRSYQSYGFREFVLCVGYKGALIRKYFSGCREWKVTCVDTGLNTPTGGRIKKVASCIKGEQFLATYGDGLSDIHIGRLVKFHLAHKRVATITAVRPLSPFGLMGINAHTSAVTHFQEKPRLDHWINGGFFVFHRRVFDYLREDDVLEKETFGRLIRDKAMVAYKHAGFWVCMDTYKDNLRLNQLWKESRAPWAVWKARSR